MPTAAISLFLTDYLINTRSYFHEVFLAETTLSGNQICCGQSYIIFDFPPEKPITVLRDHFKIANCFYDILPSPFLRFSHLLTPE